MSYHVESPVSGYELFQSGTSSPMKPQESYSPTAFVPRYISTDGFFGDLEPARQSFSDLPVAVLLVGGIVVVGGLMAFMLGGNEPRRAF